VVHRRKLSKLAINKSAVFLQFKLQTAPKLNSSSGQTPFPHVLYMNTRRGQNEYDRHRIKVGKEKGVHTDEKGKEGERRELGISDLRSIEAPPSGCRTLTKR